MTAETRGWAPVVRRAMQRTLVALLTGYRPGESIPASDVREATTCHSSNLSYALEILEPMGIVLHDLPRTFDQWLAPELDGLAEGIRVDADRWARHLHDGGPRAQARDPQTARAYLRILRPVLLD